jgi:predicted O-methyltransferase YrrM
MNQLLIGFGLGLPVGALAFLPRRLRRWRAGRQRRIPTVSLQAFDPMFREETFGPTPAAEVLFLGDGEGLLGSMSDRETWIIAGLAKRARTIFEFGTCSGKTTYLLARNAPAEARVITLTLGPDQMSRYHAAPGDTPEAEATALKESHFTRFTYSGSPVEAKIEQRFGDSKAFDAESLAGKVDLILVDGSHAYSYVKSDSEKALRMVAPGGVILWHDYRAPSGETRDVFRYLNELSATSKLVGLARTSLVAYRAPGREAPSSTS